MIVMDTGFFVLLEELVRAILTLVRRKKKSEVV